MFKRVTIQRDLLINCFLIDSKVVTDEQKL